MVQFISIIIYIALRYIFVGLFFSVAVYLGSREMRNCYSPDERLRISILAGLIWIYLLWQMVAEGLEHVKYRRQKK